MNATIIGQTEAFIDQLLSTQLASSLYYHNLNHTLQVRTVACDLANQMNLSQPEKEVLALAALFHDTGFTKTYEGHEKASQEIAEAFLKQQDYPEELINRVKQTISATIPDQAPVTQIDAILKDADLHSIGTEGYFDKLVNLRKEWEEEMKLTYTDAEWDKLNYRFLKQHDFYTPAAKEQFGPQREKNIKTLKKMVKSEKKKAKEKVQTTIAGNRTAQMMFKTALRNHIDLSTLADNKANIMLSVNAVIITIAMPLAASYIGDNSSLRIPLATLLLTCLVSMIYATLATRPIKMTGNTDPLLVTAGKSNLFFFGNFFRMNFDQYRDGMQEILEKEENLESSIMRDLFFLGKSLGTKYQQLRICYNVFMYGIILTVIAFAVTYSNL